ncbi:MAG: NUDIX hydrolase [Stellaceae bacterium]
MRGFIDAGYRLAYRLGFPVIRLWWFLRRPDQQGALVAVWHEGRVLMLRQSYRDLLDFPGGGLEHGETPRACARRELAEEVGIAVPQEALALAREMTVLRDYRRDHVSIFVLRLAEPPSLTLDRREIVAASFMTPAAALAAKLSPFARAYLDGASMS